MGADEKKEKLKILQVSNISVNATRDQIFTMFQYIGRVEELKVYPSDANITSATTAKVAFVRFDDERCVDVGQHLTNTVLIDNAMVCVPWLQAFIPDEMTFINTGGPTMAGQRQLPPHITNRVQTDADGHSVLLTVDPTMEQLGLQSYPPLPADTDPAKIEEIRRTVYIGGLPKEIDGQAVSEFFNSFIGEVMYVRMAAASETLPHTYAYVEFSNQSSIPMALQNDGIEFQGKYLKIHHSRVAIIKPQQKTADQALEEVEEAIRMGKGGERSRSPARRRRTPSPRRRSPQRKPRSRSRDRKRSRSRDTKRRSRSKDRKRSRSRERRRVSRSKDRKERSRSRDKKRSRSRDRKKDRERDRKERKRSRSRSRDRKKDRKSRSPDRKRDKKDNKENEKQIKKEVADEETSLREKLMEKAAARVVDNDDEMDVKPELPSKIKNERKRRVSGGSD